MTNTNTNDPGEAAVPAGYRLGGGWRLTPMRYEQLGTSGQVQAFVMLGAHLKELVDFGALVPIEPPVAEPPGFRVVGRSGPGVRVVSRSGPGVEWRGWVRHARLDGGDSCPNCRPFEVRDGYTSPLRMWNDGQFDILEPIPAAPVAEPAHPVFRVGCGTDHLPRNPTPVPPGPVPPEGEPGKCEHGCVTEDCATFCGNCAKGGPHIGIVNRHANDCTEDHDDDEPCPEKHAPAVAPAKAPLSPHALGCHCQTCLQRRVDGRVPTEPLWQRMREDREALKTLLLGAIIPGGALGTLSRFGFHEDEARALADQLATAIRELADEKAAHDMTRDAVKCAVDCENAMRAELDEQRGRAERAEAILADVSRRYGFVQQEADARAATAFRIGWLKGAEATRKAVRAIDVKWGDLPVHPRDAVRYVLATFRALPLPPCPEGPPAGTRCGNLDCGPNCTHGMSLVCGHDDEDSECNNQRCAQADAGTVTVRTQVDALTEQLAEARRQVANLEAIAGRQSDWDTSTNARVLAMQDACEQVALSQASAYEAHGDERSELASRRIAEAIERLPTDEGAGDVTSGEAASSAGTRLTLDVWSLCVESDRRDTIADRVKVRRQVAQLIDDAIKAAVESERERVVSAIIEAYNEKKFNGRRLEFDEADIRDAARPSGADVPGADGGKEGERDR